MWCLNDAAEYVQSSKELERRFMVLSRKMKAAYDIVFPSGELTENETSKAQFFLAIRSIIYKQTKGDAPDAEAMNKVVSEMVKKAIACTGVESIIDTDKIANGTAFIFVNKELQRVNRDALEKLNEKGIILKFPAFFARTNTALVLKEPKTKTSTRKVFLPKTVAEMLKERYQEIQEYKELFGDEFQDFNLVFCNANGRPMESQIITRALQKLIKDNDLPPVVFHSLRHSSITYKLKLNGGDIKSVQGDSGHAQVKMVTDVYSHIIDEDRRLNAQRFEETFYQKKNPSEVNGATVEPKKEPQGITEEAMLNYMVQNPDFLQKFKVLLGVGN